MIGLSMTINSCTREVYFYAYCSSGHPYWQGQMEKCYSDGTDWDTAHNEAIYDAGQHDSSVHGGVKTASIHTP